MNKDPKPSPYDDENWIHRNRLIEDKCHKTCLDCMYDRSILRFATRYKSGQFEQIFGKKNKNEIKNR